MTKPVLLFNSVETITVAVARSLQKRGIPVTFADIGGSPFPASNAFRDYVLLPDYRTNPDEFIGRLTELIETGGYGALFPCSDAGMVAIAPHYQRLAALLYIGCPEPHIVRRVLDKEQTLEAARACGMSVPVTHIAPDIASLEKIRRRLHFPMVAKPRSKVDEKQHTFKSRYFASFESLHDAFVVNPQFGSQNLLQEYCVGDGIGIEVLFHKGEAIALFQHRRLKELPVSGGGSVLSVSESLDPILTESAVALLRKLEWHGVAMVEFRHDRETRKATLMEVNGRYWGSLQLAIAAGVDFPFLEWELAQGKKPAVPSSYRVGVRLHWLAGDLRRLSSLFTEAERDDFPRPFKWVESRRLIRDCFGPSYPAVWSWRDPRPALKEFSATLRSVAVAFRNLTRNGIKHQIAQYRDLGARNSLTYLRIRALRAVGWKRDRRPSIGEHVRSILFVCHGNKIRSALAEALFLKRLANLRYENKISVASAGLIAEPELRADERARIIAKEFDVSLEDHRPRRLAATLVEQADVIFIMDSIDEARMRNRYPQAMKKVFYLGAYRDGQRPRGNAQILDPNPGGLADIRTCCVVLEDCVQRLEKVLCAPLKPSQKVRQRASATV